MKLTYAKDFPEALVRDHFARKHRNSKRDSAEVNHDVRCAEYGWLAAVTKFYGGKIGTCLNCGEQISDTDGMNVLRALSEAISLLRCAGPNPLSIDESEYWERYWKLLNKWAPEQEENDSAE